MKQIYTAPELEVSVYEADDIITISVGTNPVEGGDEGWIDI